MSRTDTVYVGIRYIKCNEIKNVGEEEIHKCET